MLCCTTSCAPEEKRRTEEGKRSHAGSRSGKGHTSRSDSRSREPKARHSRIDASRKININIRTEPVNQCRALDSTSRTPVEGPVPDPSFHGACEPYWCFSSFPTASPTSRVPIAAPMAPRAGDASLPLPTALLRATLPPAACSRSSLSRSSFVIGRRVVVAFRPPQHPRLPTPPATIDAPTPALAAPASL